jgi:hypothetical protein
MCDEGVDETVTNTLLALQHLDLDGPDNEH